MYNIIGIDPGNNLGISIFTISSKDNSIYSISTSFYNLEHYEFYFPPNKSNKLLYIEKIILDLCNKYSPVAVAIEEPFINTKFPKAITSLSRVLSIIEFTLTKYYPNIKLFTYAPKLIKANVIKGEANKTDMKLGIDNIEELKIDTRDLTEHEVDAIGIAYTLLLEIRENEWLLLYLN